MKTYYTRKRIKNARRRWSRKKTDERWVRVMESTHKTNEELSDELGMPKKVIKRMRRGTVYKLGDSPRYSKLYRLFVDFKERLLDMGFIVDTSGRNIIVNGKTVMPLAPHRSVWKNSWRFEKKTRHTADYYALVCDDVQTVYIVPKDEFSKDTRIPTSARTKYKEFLNNYSQLERC